MPTSAHTFQVISPIDGQVLLERPYSNHTDIARALELARRARPDWAATPLETRLRLLHSAVDHLVGQGSAIARSITLQMGRPLTQTPGEVRGLEERARTMLEIAPASLADHTPPPKAGFTRFVRREPVGTVLILAPWNYPFLTAINALIPALAAGNTVILKHASQTPEAGDFLAAAMAAAGLPEGVFQTLHTTHPDTNRLLTAPEVDFVAFTGSVRGGHEVRAALSGRFIGCGLELGGKDPAYVRADADLDHAIENLVDGAFFNAGQSCCGIERIYVAAERFDTFVEGFCALTRRYRLGNPMDPTTTLGPMVRQSAATFVRDQIADARVQGARAWIDPAEFAADDPTTAYLAPQVLTDVNHAMRVMKEESFGPVVGIMPVAGDEEAIRLMNDSPYGLSAALWTRDEEAALRLGARLQTGTVFMNRCDVLDPALAWTGVKDTGHGISLSALGYQPLTRVKSYHLRRA